MPSQVVEEFLQGLPKVPIEELDDDAECMICRNKYGSGTDAPLEEHPVRLPCNHIVGSDCILKWLSPAKYGKRTCPTCRAVLCRVSDNEGYLDDISDLSWEDEDVREWPSEEDMMHALRRRRWRSHLRWHRQIGQQIDRLGEDLEDQRRRLHELYPWLHSEDNDAPESSSEDGDVEELLSEIDNTPALPSVEDLEHLYQRLFDLVPDLPPEERMGAFYHQLVVEMVICGIGANETWQVHERQIFHHILYQRIVNEDAQLPPLTAHSGLSPDQHRELVNKLASLGAYDCWIAQWPQIRNFFDIALVLDTAGLVFLFNVDGHGRNGWSRGRNVEWAYICPRPEEENQVATLTQLESIPDLSLIESELQQVPMETIPSDEVSDFTLITAWIRAHDAGAGNWSPRSSRR